MNPKVEELLKTDDTVLSLIGNYLKTVAENDPVLEKKIADSNKSISQCFDYIRRRAQKQAVGNCACIEDREVFGWAVHYYDEGGSPADTQERKTNSKPRTELAAKTDVKKAVEEIKKEAEKPKSRPLMGNKKDDEMFYNLFDI